MGQSLAKVYIHIVFSTKRRQKLILPYIEKELFSYIGGICNNLKCQTINVGGYLDHIHILCMLSKQITIAKLLEHIKSHSSKWIKTKGEPFENFYWQDGYAAFSVTPRHVDTISAYIAKQREHHTKNSFKKEFVKILEKHDIEYDERFVWD